MTFDIERFVRLRPRLYHLTASMNVPRILKTRRLETARALMESAGDLSYLRSKRPDHVVLNVGGERLHVRDQRPLHEGNVDPLAGFTFCDVVEMLNDRVFFWPGDERGPIPAGKNHFARYVAEDCRVLVVSTEEMLAANANVEFCRYNSGAPRCNGGKKSPRGRETFQTPHNCLFRPGEVQEVTFAGGARLAEVELRGCLVDVRK